MKYFIINTAVASIYKEPTHQSEIVTQALFGENCQMIDKKGDWYLIQQWDGYKGWIYNFNGIVADQKYDANCVLNDLSGEIIDETGNVMTKILFGARVKAEKDNNLYKIKMPNGDMAICNDTFSLKPLIATRENIIDIANKFLGSPYLWGGKSPYGMDCSGLVQTVFKAVGIKLPRDASQQANFLQAYKININDMKSGDLLFFGEYDSITHVAISLGGQDFINACGYVRAESIDENNSLFSRKLADLFLYGVSCKKLLDSNESA